jgi:sugar-specific transcriptional regulator TrmB
MVRYKEYIKKMLEENQKLFDEFREVHDRYIQNQEKYQEDFNSIGERIIPIIKEYENRVCANTERGVYNKYSGNLAEKFQNEIREIFPMIDFVGLKTNNLKPPPKREDSFTIKKLL